MPEPSAIAIARPLHEDLSLLPFTGRIFGLFKRACHLIDDDERVIVLASSEIGNGPFSVVIEDSLNFFKRLDLDQPVCLTLQCLKTGDRQIDLRQAKIWEPKIVWPAKSLDISPTVRNILRPYANWPRSGPNTPIARRAIYLLRQAAHQLRLALPQNKNIEAAVAQLAGLGGGLTPAGDDYLIGVMAGLWLAGRSDIPPKIAKVAIPRTTSLSVAFLTAAARGDFIEPWHELVQALLAKDNKAVTKATNRIAQFGASSGRDALAGFVAVTLSNS